MTTRSRARALERDVEKLQGKFSAAQEAIRVLVIVIGRYRKGLVAAWENGYETAPNEGPDRTEEEIVKLRDAWVEAKIKEVENP